MTIGTQPGVRDNLFVPFYTTKANGNGIGLALSRQIVFNHHGQLVIENRTDGPGAQVTMSIPPALRNRQYAHIIWAYCHPG